MCTCDNIPTIAIHLLPVYSSVLAHDNTNPDAIFVRGLILYYEDNIEKAQQHFKHVLKMNPDHAKAKDTWKVSLRIIPIFD